MYLEALIRRFCAQPDLSTYDPYDIWKTGLGFQVKKLYNRRPRLGLAPAAILALLDDLGNPSLRPLYTRIEYPIVRAMAALCLLNLYDRDPDPLLLAEARRHLEWLSLHRCSGYSGHCWGLGFPNAVSKDLVYSGGVPYSTMTPYALEAFAGFSDASRDARFHSVIKGILRFFDHDIQVMEEDEEGLATSYGPFRDRTVINAVSYTMYSYSLLSLYTERADRRRIEARIRKLYAYIRRHQRSDGSWFYSPYGHSFIDCFHSCIVLKNIIKCDRIIELNYAASVVIRGYQYLKQAFLDKSSFLFRRFSVRNKPGLIQFDLYDNAEALNLALLLGDFTLAHNLLNSVLRHFFNGSNIYSQIDVFGVRRNRNTLRWAVMPFLYAASQMVRLQERQAVSPRPRPADSVCQCDCSA